MSKNVSGISVEKMARSLALCGLRRGDTVLVHSALSSVGKAEKGAAGVIEAILSVIGEEGTLACVAMSGVHPFDAKTSPSVVGAISEAIRTYPGAKRSLRPVHSVAAIGKNAEYLTASHDKCDTNCGEGTPYTKLRDLKGKILLLGVDMNRNTTLHSAEDLCDAYYLEERRVPAPTYIPGYEHETMVMKKFPPGHRDFLKLTPVLRRMGAISEGRVGNAAALVIDAEKMFSAACEALKKDDSYFLCDNPECRYCSEKRKNHAKEP